MILYHGSFTYVNNEISDIKFYLNLNLHDAKGINKFFYIYNENYNIFILYVMLIEDFLLLQSKNLLINKLFKSYFYNSNFATTYLHKESDGQYEPFLKLGR